MIGELAGLIFVGMVLAPCIMALRTRLRVTEDTVDDQKTLTPVVVARTPVADENTVRPVPIQRGSVAMLTLRELALKAEEQLREAQAASAHANARLMSEASKLMEKRVSAAARLVEAAEHELAEATKAAERAEMAKARQKALARPDSAGNYLPQNHPSLDFPRSRTFPKRAA